MAHGDPDCLRPLATGAYHRWRLGVDETVLAPAANATAVEESLESGVYMFVVPVLRPGGEALVCIAPFEVRASQPDPTATETPPDGIDVVTPDDGTLPTDNVSEEDYLNGSR